MTVGHSRSICYAPPDGSITVVLAVNSLCLVLTLFGIILTQYKAQFYVESDVTRATYFSASIFMWVAFMGSLALVCFALMQRKHLRKASADYPEMDLRKGRKGKFLIGALTLSFLGMAGGVGFGAYGIYYMETRRATTLEWTLDMGVDLDADGNLLELSILQTVQGESQTWKNVQDRLGCCSWTNTSDQYATGYCCDNRDHGCPLEAAVGCRSWWLQEMWEFNLQVCVILLIIGAAHLFGGSALTQLRFFSRSSLYHYDAYGGSLKDKWLRERAAEAAAKEAAKAAEEKAKRDAAGEDSEGEAEGLLEKQKEGNNDNNNNTNNDDDKGSSSSSSSNNNNNNNTNNNSSGGKSSEKGSGSNNASSANTPKASPGASPTNNNNNSNSSSGNNNNDDDNNKDDNDQDDDEDDATKPLVEKKEGKD